MNLYLPGTFWKQDIKKKNMVGNSFNSTVTERARLVRVKKKKIAIKLFVCCIFCRSLAAFSLSQQKSVP